MEKTALSQKMITVRFIKTFAGWWRNFQKIKSPVDAHLQGNVFKEIADTRDVSITDGPSR
jgi:hypothetical protein